MNTQPATKRQSSAYNDMAMVGRQPIYNSQMGVYGYELLFRSDDQNVKNLDADEATAQVLTNTFLAIGLENLVGGSKAAINITESFLYKMESLPVKPEQVILDVPASLNFDENVISVLKHLTSLGFTLAIDNFSHKQNLKDILPYVSILKLDTSQVAKEQLPNLVKAFSKYKNLSLLALKVENLDEYRFYRDLGFEYCQGYLLSRPRVYQTKNLPSNKLAIMRLLSVMYDPIADTDEVEKIIAGDVSLSFKMLKLINSAFFGMPSEVESVHQAIVLMGRDQLRSWVSMIALSSMGDCPMSMIELALTRARMCELLSTYAGKDSPDSFFTVGMFSALDMLMEQPMQNLLASLPLSDAIKAAILEKQGDMGEALNCVQAYEVNDWQQVNFADIESMKINKIYIESINWVEELVHII